jgi:hypothetical protein
MHAFEIAHGDDGTTQHTGVRRRVEGVMNGNEARRRRVNWHQGQCPVARKASDGLPWLMEVKHKIGRDANATTLSALRFID